METLMHSPAKIICRFQDLPDEDLEVAEAFARRPDVVRDALLEAIRHVQLRTTDITFLRIENAFRASLRQTWNEPKHLRPVLEACRQGSINTRTESVFYKHGGESGVAALSVATKQDDHKLFREIDPLTDNELIKLVKNIQTIPKRAAFVEFIEEFVQSPKGAVLVPPPHLPRPRTRRREISSSPAASSSNISQRNKRRRLGFASDTNARGSPRVESQLLSAGNVSLSTLHRPLACPPTLPLQSAPSNYQNLSISRPTNIQQQSSLGQEERWALPQTTGSQISINDPQQAPILSLEGHWEFAERAFTQGRPRTYDPGQPQWEFAEGAFTQGRPHTYDPGQPQWEFAEGAFTQGRPRTYDPGQPEWEFTEGDFTQGRPCRYDPQSAQIQEQNGFPFEDLQLV